MTRYYQAHQDTETGAYRVVIFREEDGCTTIDEIYEDDDLRFLSEYVSRRHPDVRDVKIDGRLEQADTMSTAELIELSAP